MHVIHGTYHGVVVVEDHQGIGTIPCGEVIHMATRAKRNDSGIAIYGGRRYDRDLLVSAAGLVESEDIAELNLCRLCRDFPATEGEWCVECCSGAVAYDDRERA